MYAIYELRSTSYPVVIMANFLRLWLLIPVETASPASLAFSCEAAALKTPAEMSFPAHETL